MDSEGVSDTLNWNGSPFDTKTTWWGGNADGQENNDPVRGSSRGNQRPKETDWKDKISDCTVGKGIVSDTVRGSRQDGTIGPIKITGFPDRDYHKRTNTLNRQLQLLQEKEDELLELTNEVELYIESIEDSRIRRIFRYRYLDDMSWTRVAMMMGGDHTADSCRNAHDRYLGLKK